MENIGIIGAGNIGFTLATLLKNNQLLDEEHLKISYHGRKSTLAHLEEAHLEKSIASNAAILSYSDIIFLTIKPKDYNAFRNETSLAHITHHPIFISTVAGHPLSQLKQELQYDHIYNVMPSGPETLLEGNGICALYPADTKIQSLMSAMGIQVFPVQSEAAFYLFTTALCLPAAFLQLGHFPDKSEQDHFVTKYQNEIPDFEKIYDWAKQVTDFDRSKSEQATIIRNMSTPGGITENLVQHIKDGKSFSEAFSLAVAYCISLAKA